jgi:hypothetical protein
MRGIQNGTYARNTSFLEPESMNKSGAIEFGDLHGLFLGHLHEVGEERILFVVVLPN